MTYIYSELEQFRMVSEQLEICNSLFKKQSIPRLRICMILLDNLAEVLILRHLKDRYSWDDFFQWFQPPEFPPNKRKKLNSYFDEKIKAIHKQGVITDEDMLVLKITHLHRNAAFHSDRHNPSILFIITSLLFTVVSRLTLKLSAGLLRNGEVFSGAGQSISKKEYIWLRKYGAKPNFVNYDTVCRNLVKLLGRKRKPILSRVLTTLSSDIDERNTSIKDKLLKVFGSIGSPEINPKLKQYEFGIYHYEREYELSQKLREIRYRVAKGNTEGIDREDYASMEREFKQSLAAELNDYRPRLSIQRILRIGDIPKQLRQLGSLKAALDKYSQTDEILFLAEQIVDKIYTEWETAVQLAIDISRGK
jgi:hypothetical protein